MLATLIERMAMRLAAAVVAAVGSVFILIGSYDMLSAWIGPGPAGLAMGAALLLVALCLMLLARVARQPRANTKSAEPSSMAALNAVHSFWKQHPLACMGLIGAAGLLLARRPKTLADIAAFAAQFLQPGAPPKS